MLAEILRVLFGLVAVLGLIGLCALGARRAGLVSMSGGFSKKRRLSVVETLALDARRRLVIVKCDGKEHLIVLGANGETIVENNLDAPPHIEEAPAPENPFPTFAALLTKKRNAA
jgi:flagellar protein FliO/FliZ